MSGVDWERMRRELGTHLAGWAVTWSHEPGGLVTAMATHPLSAGRGPGLRTLDG